MRAVRNLDAANSIAMKDIHIIPMQPEHWTAVAEIYREGIDTGFATFETQVPAYGQWHGSHLGTCRLVAEHNSVPVGWAALSPVSGRCVYGGVAEVSIYIAKNARGLGIGKLLMQRLILESENNGLWTLQSGIFPENGASIALHTAMGFRYIGKREKVGRTSEGVWKDNLLFERRSNTVGIA